MKKKLLQYISFFKMTFFTSFILSTILLKTQKDIFNNIIIIENTNGDIYLSQNEQKELIFMTGSQNEEEKIFYGITLDNERYFLKNKVPILNKRIQIVENKDLTNPELTLIKMSSFIFAFLIGSGNSFIELIYLNSENENQLDTFSNLFGVDSNNKGISSLVKYFQESYSLYIISPFKTENDSSYYYLIFTQIYFYVSEGISYYFYNNNLDITIKGEYISCLLIVENNNYIISCFYLNKDNNYTIGYFLFEEEKDVSMKKEYPIIPLNNTNEEKYYFIKAINIRNKNSGVYAYYSGQLNDIPTLLFKEFNLDDNEMKNKFEDIPSIQLSGYPFNNGIKYNDIIINDENSGIDLFFVSSEEEREYLIISYIIIFEEGNANQTVIRYYKLQLKEYFNMKIFHGLKAINFDEGNKNFFVLAFDFCLTEECSDINDKNGNSGLIFFSFPNFINANISVDYIEYAFNNNRNSITVNLFENCVIENNIFNYYYLSIQITLSFLIDNNYLDTYEGINLYYEDSKEIFDGTVYEDEKELRIDLSQYDFEKQINEIYMSYKFIAFAPNLEKFNEIWDTSSGDIENSHSKNFNLKSSSYAKYYININKELNKTCNDENCTLCLKEDPDYCIVCKDENYTIIYDEKYRYGKKKFCWKNDADLLESSGIIETTRSKLEIEDLINDKYINISLTDEDIKDIYEDIKQYLKENYNGENTIINTSNIKIQISTLEDQLNNDPLLSSIDLGECGEQLKQKYCKSEKDSLIILKFDIKPNNENSTYVKYEVYEPYNKTKLNLQEECSNNINIYIPIKFGFKIESEYELLDKSGYELFNENGSFYNDICATYTTENGTDILLYDRRMDIYQSTVNISLCQDGCKFQIYYKETKKAKCQCPIQESEIKNIKISNLQFDKNKMIKEFYNIIDNSNFRVLKCHNLVFKLKSFFQNIGRIIMLILIILFISLMIVYILVSSKKINHIVQEIIRLKLQKHEEKNEEKKSNKEGEKGNNIDSPKKSKKKKKKKRKPKDKTDKHEKRDKKENHVKVYDPINKESQMAPPKKKAKLSDLTLNSRDQIIIGNNENFDKKKKESNSTINKDNIKMITAYNNIKKEDMVSDNDNTPKEKNNVVIFQNQKNLDETNTVNMKLKSLENENKKIKKINKIDVGELNDYEINGLDYQNALKLDKRTYFQYYLSLIKKKQLIIFTFLPSNDYNLLSLKISLFIVSFSLYLSINGFFFNDKTMHKIYKDKGAFNIIYQIPQILYSTIVSSLINIILKNLSLSEKNILIIKTEKNINIIINKGKNILRCIKIKFIIYFSISFLLMLFFWYFISCFCAVYKNTQIILFKDTLISFGLSNLYPFGINLIPGIFRITALRDEKKDKKCLYIFSQYVAII